MWGWKHWSVLLKDLEVRVAKLLEQGLTKEHSHCEDTIITVIVVMISFLLLKLKERAQICLRAYSMTLLININTFS